MSHPRLVPVDEITGRPCVFCPIVDVESSTGPAPLATIVAQWADVVAFLPRPDADGKRGCTDGHVLFVPRHHVTDLDGDEHTVLAVMRRVRQWARNQGHAYNVIVNVGPAASQTVGHLHVHYVPRAIGDGVTLPWAQHLQP